MPDEIELKLGLSPKDLRRLQALPWLRALAEGPATQRTLVSIYYDTKKCTLRDIGISLRVRCIGEMRFQTIKAFGSNAPFARKEWEMKISGDHPDFTRMRGTALEPLLSNALKRNLKPVFETHVRRTTLLVRMGGSEVEIAMDHGAIKCADLSRPISEVELELKAGDPTVLCKIAARLSREFPVRYGAKTKSERGYALLEGRYDKPVRGGAIVLKKDTDTAAAFQVIGLSCLQHLASDEDAVRKRDGEGIHQMRVGLRRLRAAISIFKGVLQDRQSQNIKAELKWLTEQLAPARDYDVFLEDSVQPMQEAQPQHSQMAVLHSALLQERAAGFAKAKNAVASERYRRLTLSAALWLADGNWSRYGDSVRRRRRARPAKYLARETLTKRSKTIVKKIEKLEKLDAAHRHKLRIAIKKLRYATEFFDTLFAVSKKERKACSKVLAKLQTAMGKLNDIRVHESLTSAIACRQNGAKHRETSLALDLVKKQDQRNIEPLLSAAAKAGARLAKLKPFWK
jgi:inorganic triphosphatase YgiF